MNIFDLSKIDMQFCIPHFYCRDRRPRRSKNNEFCSYFKLIQCYALIFLKNKILLKNGPSRTPVPTNLCKHRAYLVCTNQSRKVFVHLFGQVARIKRRLAALQKTFQIYYYKKSKKLFTNLNKCVIITEVSKARFSDKGRFGDIHPPITVLFDKYIFER